MDCMEKDPQIKYNENECAGSADINGDMCNTISTPTYFIKIIKRRQLDLALKYYLPNNF